MKTLNFAIAIWLASFLMVLTAIPALAQGLTQGAYHWYAPEHERYGRTEFYSQPSFQSSLVRITSTQRFKLVGGSKGWALVEFDAAGKAYIHLRILYTLVYDPAAGDPFYEFKRASVFTEEPAKLEARLKGRAVTTTPDVVDSKLPAWKRYKDAWGLKPGRPTATVGSEEPGTDPTRPTARPITGSPTGKPRSKYPLLPPIGSEPPQEAAPPESPEREAEPPAR